MMKYKLTKFAAFGVSLVSLSACGVYGDHAMPTGYTYHHKEYKSPAPVVSAVVTSEQKQYMDSTQAEQFRNATYSLLERLTMRAGMPPKPVYISAPEPMTTFYANIDNDLRESMRHIGYAISDFPQGAYVFTYEAMPLSDAGNNNVQLTLRVFEAHTANARQLTEEVGQYFIQGADTLTMGSANQTFLKVRETTNYHATSHDTENHGTTSSNVTSWERNQATQHEAVMAKPIPVIAPPTQQAVVRAPIVQAPVIQQPVVQVPVASVAPVPKRVVVAPVDVGTANAPRAVSRSVNTGGISQSMTSYANQREPSRDAIKVINHGDEMRSSAPMVKRQETMSDQLPSLEELEAQINMLDAEILGANKAEALIRSRVSR